MRHRRLLATVVLGTAVVGLAGCGGSDDEPSATPSSTTITPTTSPAAPTSSTPATGASYLPVPAGVTLTEPGSRLGLKEPAVAAWSPRQDLVGVVGVTVTRIEQTTVKASLAGFDLTPAERAATPYFVHARVTNAGQSDVGGRLLPVYGVDEEGVLVPPTGVAPGFEPCSGSTLPSFLLPGAETRSCLIFLVPAGHSLAAVEFRPPEGVEPITWTGQVRPVKSDKPR